MKTRERNPTTSIFAWLCEISHTMRNHWRQPKDFTHHAKFSMVCKIFLCTDSVIFLFSDILCNFLVSPCNQPRYFLLYLFIYLLGRLYIRRETGGVILCMLFIKHLKNPGSKKYKKLLLCLSFSFCFHFSY